MSNPCTHAASGCDYPAGECAGLCMQAKPGELVMLPAGVNLPAQLVKPARKPEALRLADGNEKCAKAWLESSDAHKFRMNTAAELRRLHALNSELLQALKERAEAELESIGAGGVGPLRPQSGGIPPDWNDPANIDSPMNACMYREHCKRWKAESAQHRAAPVAWLIKDTRGGIGFLRQWVTQLSADLHQAHDLGFEITPLYARQKGE